MFEEMRLAATLHKGLHQDAELIPAHVAFQLATSLGAQAVFLDGDHGTLHPGAACDMVLLDAGSTHMLPNHDLMSDIVYACGAEDVRDVFIDGRLVIANGEPLTIDTERVTFEVKRIKEQITSDM
jgi:5-methylthioadenosine/S-adenosylhomocysteine deaminase